MSEAIHSALAALLTELLDGAATEAAWVLNRQDPGLLESLGRLSAAEASTVPVSGGASIAAHVDHLRYGLELLNRWSRGEEPFADADYSASWRRVTVSDGEWTMLRQRLRDEAHLVSVAKHHDGPRQKLRAALRAARIDGLRRPY